MFSDSDESDSSTRDENYHDLVLIDEMFPNKKPCVPPLLNLEDLATGSVKKILR
jgi:hypothetical protein